MNGFGKTKVQGPGGVPSQKARRCWLNRACIYKSREKCYGGKRPIMLRIGKAIGLWTNRGWGGISGRFVGGEVFGLSLVRWSRFLHAGHLHSASCTRELLRLQRIYRALVLAYRCFPPCVWQLRTTAGAFAGLLSPAVRFTQWTRPGQPIRGLSTSDLIQ